VEAAVVILPELVDSAHVTIIAESNPADG